MLSGDVTEFFGHSSFAEFANDDASGNDREIGCQGTFAAEIPQDRPVIRQDGDEYLGAEIVDVRLRCFHASYVGGVLNDMHEQPDKAIHERLPSRRFLRQAIFQQGSVDFRECHDDLESGENIDLTGAIQMVAI